MCLRKRKLAQGFISREVKQMPVLAVLEILVKVYFAVHVVKTGRDRYWLWIIIFFPGIGSLVYFFAEFVPDLQGNYKVRKFGTGLADRINPTRRLRDLENQLELAPSVQNRKLLAEEYGECLTKPSHYIRIVCRACMKTIFP